MKKTMAFLAMLLPGILLAQDSITLQLKWWHQFQFAGYYAAQQQGYYQAAGLTVDIKPGGSGIVPVKEVVGNKAQFGITGADLILDHANGEPVVALAALFQHSPYVIISLKENEIVEPSNLVGKTVMVSGEQGWVQVNAMLMQEGISSDSVNVIQHSWNNNDLVSGKVDAMSAYSSVEPWQFAAKGIETNVIRPVNYGTDFYGDVLFTSKEQLESRPGMVEQFRAASMKGWEYAMAHVEEMVDYILTLPGVRERGITRELLLREAAEMKKLILPNLIETGHMNQARWQHILLTYQSLGLISNDVNLNGFIYDHQEKQLSDYSRYMLYAGIILLALSIIFLVNFFTMKRVIRHSRKKLEAEISTRLETQMKLHSTEEFLETAVNGASLGIWSWDVKNGSVYFNNTWKTMLGYQPEEIKEDRETLLNLIHSMDRDRILNSITAHIHGTSDFFEGTMRMKKKCGDWKWVFTKAQAKERDENGVAMRLTGIHLDIDELKNKESELIRISEELMRNNTDLRQFSYVISHNMRAPVANIMGLIRFFDSEQLQDHQRNLIGKIEFSAQMLMNTMQDLNNILNAKSVNSKDGECIKLRERLHMLLELVGDKLRTSKGRIDVSVPQEETIWFPADVFDGIVINLLSNAIKFRDLKRALVVHLRTDEDEHYVYLHVHDNGRGLDLEKFGHKLFGLYQRFHPYTEGKGLGLYLSRTQVENLGGKLSLKSVAGEGSVFTVAFPKEPFCAMPARVG